MEHKIGETFCLEDGTKLEVVKSTCNCKGCYFFNDKDKSCSRTTDIICSAPRRKDKEFVIFKQVKDNNMEEKRNIQISLEEAREWYNSVDPFKRDLALKAYKEEELKELNYSAILDMLPEDVINKNIQKYLTYIALINVTSYLNSIYPKEYCKETGLYFKYILSKGTSNIYNEPTWYKWIWINKVCHCYNDAFMCTFNSEEAAKKAIDILGDELNVLFE